MKFESDTFLIMLVICGAVYLAGYRSLAIGLLIVTVFANILTGGTKKKVKGGVSVGGITVKGAEVLEPIIIETTRGPPFRIPSKMDIRIKPNWSAKNWAEKAGMGLASFAKIGYRTLHSD
ncbi:MAG: hypothetical protein J7K68_00240 [Candidatus Diapherotrites archaeon]|nr:hypothetical protein [Candidatus Diapherotrites archaeon]